MLQMMRSGTNYGVHINYITWSHQGFINVVVEATVL